ncbi:MAG: L-aspartate oxidase [Deltaproteobacteria bacterium]|nr:L-aspartate oxidase [Deltaproteobacteria bacterium]
MPKYFDVLIIGGGVAGLTLALRLDRKYDISVICKSSIYESASSVAQGGIAAVFDREDSFEDHIRDTLRAGEGLSDEKVVRMCIQKGPTLIRWLESLGVEFSRKENSEELDLGLEGGHSHRRIVHAKDISGKEVIRVLARECLKKENIHLFEHHFAVDLISTSKLGFSGRNRVLGVYVLNLKSGEIETFFGGNVVLATGGAGKTYLYTSNPDISTGDGIAMAYRSGAVIENLEFVQFHPTCLYHPEAKSFLISEALRGEGGRLLRPDGSPFMHIYHARKELAPRDIVARSIDFEMKKNGFDYVLLDVTHLGSEFLMRRFPSIYQKCLEYGFDLAVRPIPVVPAAHYFCGGVKTDIFGKTNIEGLFAIGEVASTGLHGANRLASNSLLEGLVFGDQVATYVNNKGVLEKYSGKRIPDWDAGDAVDSDEAVVVSQNWDEIRRLMWNYVGIVRSNKRLKRALRRINLLKSEINEYYWNFKITKDLLELRNIALVSELVIRSAITRKESRGLHYTIDYPFKSEKFAKPTRIKRRL